jgi:ABC-type lipoprotein export system ATPase subunit
LSLQKYFLFRKTTINILQGITVDFEPGKLNVVMGPSGITLCWKLSDVEVLGKAVS